MRGDLLAFPLFLRLDFYERAGALRDFLAKHIREHANLCYFNYRQSGERVGRALIGLDFQNSEEQSQFLSTLPPEQGEGYRACKAVDEATRNRLVV